VINADGCDTIVSLSLNFIDAGSIGLVGSVTMALDDTVTLSVNEGFLAYQWNNDPMFNENEITIIASELGEGTFYYTIEVEDINGCILNDTAKVVITFALNTHAEGSLECSVYPNPVSGNQLNMDYHIATEARLMIYSQDGKEISRDILYPTTNHVIVYLPETSGLYNLVITNKEGMKCMKVLKL
jgi:hypothetical protein